MAADVYSRLLASGIISYPGPMSQRGGGGASPLITLANENSRYRITIASAGTQVLYVYGSVNEALLEAVLKSFVGDNLRVRNLRT
jgi:hypothetical protein